MDTPRTNGLLSRGLLQLATATTLCLCLATVGIASGGANSTSSVERRRARAEAAATIAPAPAAADMFTFSQPGRSFVEYRHAWPSPRAALRLTARLRFRTTRPAGVLALLTSRAEPPTSSVPLPPTTLVRLHRAALHVSVSESRGPDSVVPAQSGVVVGRGRCSPVLAVDSRLRPRSRAAS